MPSNDILLLFVEDEANIKYSKRLRYAHENFRIILINNHRH